MLGMDSSWAPATRNTKLGPILRFQFPTKEAEIYADPSLKGEYRVNHRRASGKQITGSLPFAGVAYPHHFGWHDDE